jgi:Mn2+/Fe2+ NRAMP family transporter
MCGAFPRGSSFALDCRVGASRRPAAENRDYLLMVVAVLGTTISPYLFFWQASQEVEEMKQNRSRRPLKERASFKGAIAWRRIRN